ncbi:hypothetical protein [Bradyrhizobium sp. 2TAF24]|uniref:hypothetical protein n=1 Tax=Bradyrhizobium sp. 2TAF24 TaxID=3233011 RepID=UPI003F90EC45
MTITLPDRNTDEGAETRLLMSEARGPSFASFNLSDTTRAMALMDLVLVNRLTNRPGRFGAPGASTLRDIIKAKGQFAGFETYPNYDSRIVGRLQNMLSIANNTSDRRSGDFTSFIQAAIDRANAPNAIVDPSPGLLCAWRTAGASSPGSAFTLHVSVAGNDFYYI